jgi:hypothetical protein
VAVGGSGSGRSGWHLRRGEVESNRKRVNEQEKARGSV